MVREGPAQPAPPPKDEAIVVSAERARGGEIILKRPVQRWVFIAGLAGAVMLAFVLKVLLWP
jgi:hypothetical protein